MVEAECAVWAERLTLLAERFCAPSSLGDANAGDEDAELDLLRSQLASVAESARLADFQTALPLSVFLSELEGRIQKGRGAAGLFGGGVTFCQLVPLRALPFRVVALLGMSDDGFPRLTRRSDFDRMAQHPRLGDPSPRDDDRQLFLEAMLSPRRTIRSAPPPWSSRRCSIISPWPTTSRVWRAPGATPPSVCADGSSFDIPSRA